MKARNMSAFATFLLLAENLRNIKGYLAFKTKEKSMNFLGTQDGRTTTNEFC